MVMLEIIHTAVLCVPHLYNQEPPNETHEQSYLDISISLSSVWQSIHLKKPNKETHEQSYKGASI